MSPTTFSNTNLGKGVQMNPIAIASNESFAVFATHPAPRGIPLRLEPGHYWLSIVIYGDNFKPVKRGYAVHWDGKDYKKIDMQEMNDPPKSSTDWPWQIENTKPS